MGQHVLHHVLGQHILGQRQLLWPTKACQLFFATLDAYVIEVHGRHQQVMTFAPQLQMAPGVSLPPLSAAMFPSRRFRSSSRERMDPCSA